MANVPQQRAQMMPSWLTDLYDPEEIERFTSGARQPYAVISTEGHRFSVKKDKESILLRVDPQDPDSAPIHKLVGIILDSSPHISKKYYVTADSEKGKWPDCWSVDGIRPSDRAENKQCDTCGACQHNKFGSAPPNSDGTPNKAKACKDRKRVAFLHAMDIGADNPVYGPCLLDIPTMSLPNLAALAQMMKQHRIPPYTLIVEISLDPTSKYQKLLFKPNKGIKQGEAGWLKQMRDSDIVQQMLVDDMAEFADEDDSIPAQQEETRQTAQKPPQPSQKPAQQPQKPAQKPTQSAPQKPPQPASQPAQEEPRGLFDQEEESSPPPPAPPPQSGAQVIAQAGQAGNGVGGADIDSFELLSGQEPSKGQTVEVTSDNYDEVWSQLTSGSKT